MPPTLTGSALRAFLRADVFRGKVFDFVIPLARPAVVATLGSRPWKPKLWASICYRLITFVPFYRDGRTARIHSASGQREGATNRLGEHGGMGFGPMRQGCKVLHEAA
jgi:hypothetical protein